MTSSNLVKVSVCMITYNHEKFIGQAIESVMMQQTDFDYELVIGEDCSTDRTGAVVLDYAGRYSDRIRPLLREHNLGMNPNFVQTFQSCRGEYVALLEGDDFWTDPLKLQQQADYLSSHPNCSMCFHPCHISIDNDVLIGEKISWPPGRKSFYTLHDMLKAKYLRIHTSSVFVRNNQIDVFPEWFYEMPMGDLPFIILSAQNGNIGYLDEAMGTYRIHKGGIWSQSDETHDIERTIAARDILIRNLDNELKQILQRVQYLLYLDLLKSYLTNDDRQHAKMIIKKGLKGFYYSENKSLGGLLRLLLNIFMPKVYNYLAKQKKNTN